MTKKEKPIKEASAQEETTDTSHTSSSQHSKQKKGEERQRIRIKVRAFDHKIIDQSTRTIIETAERAGATVIGPIPLPTERRRWTVNRSTFVHKDARDQFEMRIHKRLIDIVDPTAKTIESLSSLHLPAGVEVEIKM